MQNYYKLAVTQDEKEKHIDDTFALMKRHNIDPADSWMHIVERPGGYFDMCLELGCRAAYLKNDVLSIGWKLPCKLKSPHTTGKTEHLYPGISALVLRSYYLRISS